jgi:hypothetical protein
LELVEALSSQIIVFQEILITSTQDFGNFQMMHVLMQQAILSFSKKMRNNHSVPLLLNYSP